MKNKPKARTIQTATDNVRPERKEKRKEKKRQDKKTSFKGTVV